MEMETSGSADEGSGCENSVTFNYVKDSDEEGGGLADAFMQFEAQAEKRTLELLESTDQHLFQEILPGAESVEEEGVNAEEGSFPAYIYMSDQFRLKKPPEFQHWQQNFQYLQVTGAGMLEGESQEHIQILRTELKAGEAESNNEGEACVLKVGGRACLQEPTLQSRDVYEEIIMCDGLMEEVLEHHDNRADEIDEDLEHGSLSPLNTLVEEVLDGLTMECFSSTVVPQLTSFYKTMLEKQQHTVRTTREERETAANRTIEEQIAFERARQLRLEQEVLEEAARIEALEQQRQEELRIEAERREQLLKQQLEENDEEEVKIKTLAYSHTREWYQPNKKCFAHRGRQLTYLKPVLQVKESEEMLVSATQERSPLPNTDRRRTRQSNILKKSRATLQKPQPEWVTGGALTNDKLCDISWVKKSARPPANPPPSPSRTNGSRRRRKNQNQKDETSLPAGVQLPTISRTGVKPASATANLSSTVDPFRKRNVSPKPSHASAPPLKSTSPYQIPPRVVADSSRKNDRRHFSANAPQ